jgi:hypothetical protein
MRAWLVTSLVLTTLVPQAALAGPPDELTEATAASEASGRVGELSQQGARRGGVEIGIGVVLTGTAIGLIAFGTLQFIRAREHVAFCNRGVTYIDELQNDSGGIDPCVFDPPPLGFASAGLSWGFSIPLLVGGGMMFARARRVMIDAKAVERIQLTAAPWWRREGGGASLSLRF